MDIVDTKDFLAMSKLNGKSITPRFSKIPAKGRLQSLLWELCTRPLLSAFLIPRKGLKPGASRRASFLRMSRKESSTVKKGNSNNVIFNKI